MTKTLIGLFLTAAALHAAETLSLTCPPAPVRRGATIQCSLSVAGATAAAYQYSFTLPSGYTIVPSSAPAGKALACNAGSAICVEYPTGPVTAFVDGAIATVSIKVPTSAAPGAVSASLSGLMGATPAAQLTAVVSGPPAAILILDPRDINGDGKIDSSDVLAVINAIFTQDLTADIDGDGKVTVADLIAVAKATGQ